MMRLTGFLAMCAVSAMLVLLVVSGVPGQSLLADAFVQPGMALVGLILVVVGLRRHEAGRTVSLILVAALVSDVLGSLFWYAPVLLGGDETLPSPSVADGLWILSALLTVAAIAIMLCRLENAVGVLLDTLALVIAVGVTAGFALIGPDLAASELSVGERVAQAAAALVDVVIVALVIRTLLAPRHAPLSLRLIVLAGAGQVVSDVAWNWLTISGTYVPGTWADWGWLAMPLLFGLAALHPSIGRQATRAARREEELRFRGPLLLCIASLVAPLALGAHAIFPSMPEVDHDLRTSVTVLLCGGVLSLLVATRFALLLGRARRLTEAAEAALDERSHRLELSETRHRGLLEQLPAVVAVFQAGPGDDPLLPIYVSPQTEAILGVASEEWLLAFDTVKDRVHPDDWEELDAAMRAAARGEPRPVEYRFIRPDGREIWLRDPGGVIDEHDGVPVLQSMLFDVTAAKRAEVERDGMEMELRLRQKLEAVGEMAAGIAHEINTPIQFVGDTVSFLDAAFKDLLSLVEVQQELRRAVEAGAVTPQLLERARDAEELADLEYLLERVPAAFARADDGVQRVARIVRAMREFAHPPTAEKAPVDLNELIRSTLVVAANAYKYVARVETDLGDLPPVVCNGGDLSQVLLNLIVNAAHAIEDVVGDSGELGTIRITTRVAGEDVLVTISDTGAGIPADVAARVFDPFFTTKEVGRGTGQGLALARSVVVERHAGALTFDSDSGDGTSFHVRLPAGSAEAVAA